MLKQQSPTGRSISDPRPQIQNIRPAPTPEARDIIDAFHSSFQKEFGSEPATRLNDAFIFGK
jgi:hypothetical protein